MTKPFHEYTREELVNRRLGPEAARSRAIRFDSGFYAKYMSGTCGLDIGFRGSQLDNDSVVPVLPSAFGVDLGLRDYDGIHLPFASGSQDYVFASHILEHIEIPQQSAIIQEWFRVLRTYGFLIITVPHMHLYEKKWEPPSRWNIEHKAFFTPMDICQLLESSFSPNTYRIRHLCDNDRGFDYSIGPERHSNGCYEIECVVQKLKEPQWSLI